MPTMIGKVTIVQEGRFQLVEDDGSGHLFILGPHAAAETHQLRPLAARQARVKVTYEDVARVIGMVAKKIELERA